MSALDNSLSNEAIEMLDSMVKAARVRFFMEAEGFLSRHNLPSTYMSCAIFFDHGKKDEVAVYQITATDRVQIL